MVSLTCQTKGRVLRFVRTRRIKRVFHGERERTYERIYAATEAIEGAIFKLWLFQGLKVVDVYHQAEETDSVHELRDIRNGGIRGF